ALLWLVFTFTRQSFFLRAAFTFAPRLPLIGPLLRLLASEKIFGILAIITETPKKTDISEAFGVVAECEKNPLYKEALAELARAAKEQTPLARVLNKQKNRLSFPVIVRRMLILGEKRGDVPSAIHSLACILSEELDIEIRRFTSLIEPILVISIALIVGGIGLMIQRVFASLQTAAIGG
ncbi:MAG: type II secretion system F family protein, partial [Candidatus Jacksonbacteria bacterium]|nr:type II secretion system F family protein [Candidatus Jacksonbacteria bacterium]